MPLEHVLPTIEHVLPTIVLAVLAALLGIAVWWLWWRLRKQQVAQLALRG